MAPTSHASSGKSRRSPHRRGPVVVEVASWRDARSDLTAAADIHAGIGDDFSVHLLRLHEPDLTPLPEDGVFQFSSRDPALAQKLEELFRSLQPDIVHTHRLEDFRTIAAAARRAEVSHLVHSLDSQTDAQPTRNSISMVTTLSGHDSVLVAMPGAAVNEAVGDGRTFVIRPGIDCGRYQPGDVARARRKIGLPIGQRIVGCASPADHLDPLLKALFRLPQDVHIALFGPAILNAQQRMHLRRYNLEERIHVLGPWAEPQLIYQAIDAYFHGPGENPIPRPVLAAQASGKRVIATVPIHSGALCPRAGVLLPSPFVPAIVSAIKKTLSDSNAVSPREFIETNWNSGSSMRSYGELFRSLASGGIEPAHATEPEAPTPA